MTGIPLLDFIVEGLGFWLIIAISACSVPLLYSVIHTWWWCRRHPVSPSPPSTSATSNVTSIAPRYAVYETKRGWDA